MPYWTPPAPAVLHPSCPGLCRGDNFLTNQTLVRKRKIGCGYELVKHDHSAWDDRTIRRDEYHGPSDLSQPEVEETVGGSRTGLKTRARRSPQSTQEVIGGPTCRARQTLPAGLGDRPRLTSPPDSIALKYGSPRSAFVRVQTRCAPNALDPGIETVGTGVKHVMTDQFLHKIQFIAV